MAAYRQVYDLRHLQADCQELGISSGTLRLVIQYGQPLPFSVATCSGRGGIFKYEFVANLLLSLK